MSIKINDVRQIWLGIQGENNAREIRIDVSEWLSGNPNGSFSIWMKAPGSNVAAATGASFDAEEGVLSWSPSSTETYTSGEGTAEIRMTEGEVIKKTKEIRIGISPAVTGQGAALPSDWQAYINEVDRIKGLAVAAKNAAETAQTGAETAKEGAETAQEAAQAAQSAAESAEAGARAAQTGAVNAQTAAQGSAVSAQNAAQAAQNDAGTALNAQAGAVSAMNAAETERAAAETAASSAAGSATAAETAKGKAEDAQTAAEQAQADAEQAAQDAQTTVQDVVDDISDLKSAIGEKYTKPQTGIPATDLRRGQGTLAVAGPDGAVLSLDFASFNDIKAGTNYKVLHSGIEVGAVFYGLAKAAGDATQAGSSLIGTYTESAKSAISNLLDAPETVSGTTPSITGKSGIRYVCGEVATLSITPPASGDIEVIFTSGTTATVLTVPNTVKFPEWFDVAALEANRTYDIIITNATYGVVTSWA